MIRVDSNAFSIREFCISDYDAALALWQSAEGVGLNESDTKSAIAAFLKRNPGLSFVATEKNKIVGTALCGHDGRRGYLHHLAVAKQNRKIGIGKALIEACLTALRRNAIPKCNIFLFSTNREGKAFWTQNGWRHRDDLEVLQKAIEIKPSEFPEPD